MKQLRFLTAVLLPDAAIFPILFAADAPPAGQAAKPASEPRSHTLIDTDWRCQTQPEGPPAKTGEDKGVIPRPFTA